MTADRGDCSILVLLDLSAAFDTIDHQILTKRLHDWVGISGSALDWFVSYLSDRTFAVNIGEFFSPSAPLSCGVPQGSVLGPLLFTLYMLPLGQLLCNFKINYHMYADDLQLHFSFNHEDLPCISRLLDCLDAVKVWMTDNWLQLNKEKTEILIFAPEAITPSILQHLGTYAPFVRSSMRNLGVVFDGALSFEPHINQLTKSCFLHLRNINKLRPIVSYQELEMLIHAFISSRIDYCNSLFPALKKSALSRLQSIQNAAARLLSRASRYSHITPILISLHWLPVQYRIHFKILIITYRCLQQQAPIYLLELLHPLSSTRSLRSTGQNLLTVPRTRLKTRGDRAFVALAPRLWNDLPAELRLAPSLDRFKGLLKTHLFRQAFC